MNKNILFTALVFLTLQPIFSQTFVRMEKVNGVYEIPCKVNGIEMKFILDTGASDISISKTEANFLAKQGLLKEDDIIGSQKYQTADGSIIEGTQIIVKEIKIQDLYIQNVSATVMDNANAPLLFGQSALSKFGRFEIENDILRIYPKEIRNVYEFLNIDLTTSIEAFGLSRANLEDAKPIIGIPFEALNISEEHEFMDLEFDKQSVIFDNTGKIVMVGLTKRFNDKSAEIRREKSETFYHLMQDKFTDQYGSADNKMSKISKWDKEDYEIIMNIQSDFQVGVFYTPKLFVKESLPDLTVSDINRTRSAQDDLRNEVAKSLNDLVNTTFNNLNASARTENKALIFSFAYKIEKDGIVINEFADFISFAVLDYIVNSKSAYNALNVYSEIKFDYKIIDADSKKYNVIRLIKIQDYQKLKHPLNKELFIKFVQKYNG